MSFSDLSPELIATIVSHLNTPPSSARLASYATVSKAFQDAVETTVFSSVSITSDELEKLEKALESRKQRRALIGRIELIAILPTYSDQACAWYERKPDHERNNDSFSSSVARLFGSLSKCDDYPHARPIDFCLHHVRSPMDVSYRGTQKLRADKKSYRLGQRKDLFEHRYEHSYVHLLHSDALPSIQRVRTLTLSSGNPRHMAPAVAPLLAAKLPHLDTIEWRLYDEERRYPEIRTQLREELSQNIAAWNPAHATRLDFKLRHHPPENDDFRNASLGDMQMNSMDGLSNSLGRCIQASNLVRVDLGGPICVGPELFWPEIDSNSIATRWSNLQFFFVSISPVRPDGGWYLIRDPVPSVEDDDESDEDDEVDGPEEVEPAEDSESDYDSDESFFEQTERPPDEYNERREDRLKGWQPIRHFRTYPDPEVEPLFQAAARAAACMPKVKTFGASLPVRRCARTNEEDKAFGIAYVTSGTADISDEGSEDVHKKRLYWMSPRNWRMGETTQDLWNEVLGDDGIVRYTEW